MGQEVPAQGAPVPTGALPALGGWGAPGVTVGPGPSEHPPQQGLLGTANRARGGHIWITS